MKIILTQSVDGFGNPGDVVEVKDGFGRNFLIPRGFAVAWTKGCEKQVTQIKRAQKSKEIRGVDHAKEVKASLEGLNVVVKANAGENGKLFGSITANDIAVAVKQAGGPSVDKRAISFKGHIKNVGSHKVVIRLHPAVEASFAINVVAG
ncbi:MAG: ribosomal protein [Actinomycetota bacterium]